MKFEMSRRNFLRTAVIGGGLGLAATTGLTACASGSSSRLVVYTNAASDGRGDWMVKKASEAGFNVTYVDLGGGDLKNRLLAERGRPQADVVFGLNDAYFYQLVDDEVLDTYTPAWADAVSDQYGDRSHFWPMYRFPILLVYNTAKWSPETAPKDWPDLWQNQQFWRQYETPSALGGMTSQTVIAGILVRYAQNGGRAGISDAGWNAIQQFFAHGNRAVEGVDLYARMATGQVSMGQMWMHGRIPREKQYGIQTKGVNPEIGVPMVVESVAMVNNTPRAELAANFIDWWGSAQVTSEFSNEFYYVPINEDARATANQEAIKEANSYNVQQIDWRFVAENLDEWIETTTLEYLQ
ncbi:substrate-binding domain-containing protein [Gordonia sp. NPDC003425]